MSSIKTNDEQKMKYIFFYKTDIGLIGIAEENNQVTNVFFENDLGLNRPIDPNNYCGFNKNLCGNGFSIQETELLKEAVKQLNDYLHGKCRSFSLPLAPSGTEFMKGVWKCLCNIPYGKTKSYKEIAEEVGNPKACRAVGLANNTNPIPIFIPCHRVIGANGKLTGYRGGLEIKQQLLELEKQYGNI